MKKSKRNAAIVVLSSDDDDEDLSLKSNFTQPKSKSVSVPRKNPKRVKTVSLSASCPRSSKDGSVLDEMKRFCEEFDDDFTGIKVSAGLGSNNDMWVDKHKPHFLEELAVHKKKVEEVKTWFEGRLKAVMATIHAIASHLGVTIFEWTTPTPTIWSEHLHNSNSGLQYRSKLDEFEGFVERVRKYGLGSPTLKGSHASVILLIDDLPLVNGRAAYGRLQRCLKLLVQFVRIPTAIVITNYDKDDSADFSTGCWEELLLSLHSAGACKVNFNPVTVNSVKKTLTTICRKEKREFGADTIELIAKASGGDIRHAITSLQYLCLKPHRRPILPSKERLDNASYLDDVFCLPFGKDENLSLFHALGKFLHNKRESERTTASVLDFLTEEAIDDAWLVASYLSDADFLLSSLNGHLSRDYGAENIIQSAAASVAARGVLFGNAHPVSSRWHAIRRPKLWEAEQSSRRNKCQMLSQRGDLYNSLTILDQIVMATDFRPVLKWLGYRASENFQANNMVEGESDSTCLHENKLDISDDEIEDC